MLERTSYEPVLNFLSRLGLYAEDVSEGQNCIDKLLYNSDIYTPRNENPLEVRGQRVFHCHRVQGRTDLVVLRTRRHGGPIIRNMVEFAIEIKTVAGPQKSRWLFVGSATSIDRAQCIQYTEIPSCCTVKPGEDTPCRLSRLQSGWMELCYQTEKMQHVCCCHSLREKGCRRTQYIV